MPRLTLDLTRWRKALAVGVAVTVAASLVPLTAGAATVSTYRDDFLNESFSGSDGTDSWATAWTEAGEADGPGDGAIEVTSDGHCHTDICLRLGMNGPASASVTRSFDATGGDTITLTFDYKRHVHGSGNGQIVLSASSDGSSYSSVATYQLSIDDGSQQSASHDLSSFAGSTTWIKFELIGADDDTHMNIDHVQVVVEASNAPTFDQDLADRTDTENDTISITSGASHPGGDTLVYSAIGLPPGISIDPDTGDISGTIDYIASASSPYSTEITVTDDDGDTDTDTFTWTVDDLNRAPTAADGTEAVPEDTAGHLVDLLDPAYGSDPDGDSLTVTGLDLTGVANGTVTDNGDGTVTYVPDVDFDGTESFAYTVDDGKSGNDSGTVTLDITPSPDSPTISALADLAVAEGTLAVTTAVATDPDTGDDLVFSLVAGPDPVPGGAAIDGSTGEFSWLTKEAHGPGMYEFGVKVTDSSGRSAQTSLRISVAEANEAPILGSIGPLESAEGEPISLTPSVTDPDLPSGDLAFSATGLPDGLTLNESTGVISGTLSFTSDGIHVVTLTVSDDGSPPKTDSVTFSWTITATNRPPEIVDSPSDMKLKVNETIVAAVEASDPDGGAVTYSASGLPDGVAIAATTGRLSGAPTAAAAGKSYAVVVKAKDAGGASTTTSFSIVVAAVASPTTVPTQAVTTSTNQSTTTTSVAEIAAIPPQEPPSHRPTDQLSVAEAVKAKQELVVSLGDHQERASAASSDNGDLRLDPREGLTVSFRSAVETLQSHLLTAIALGVTVSILLLIGVDRDDKRRENAQLAGA